MLNRTANDHYQKTKTAHIEAKGIDERALVVNFIPIIERVVSKYQHVSDVFDLEDFSQMCLIELVNLFRKGGHDFESTSFESYFRKRCEWIVKDALRSSSIVSHYGQRAKSKHDQAMKKALEMCGRPVSDNKLVEMGLISEGDLKLLYWNEEANQKEIFDETIHEIQGANEHCDVVESLKNAIMQLNKKEQIILSLMYQEDLSQSEIARILNVKSQQVISYQLKKIYSQLSLALGV